MEPVIYEGPHDQVTLAPSHGDYTFPRGEPVEVPSELAARLLTQATFVSGRKRRVKADRSEPDADDRG